MVRDRKKERYEVLYEDIKAMFQVVSEGHGTLDRKVDGVLGEVRGLRQEVRDIGKAVTETRQRLDVLINRFEVHDHAHTS